MIDLYYWPTPNGQKITIFLEESNLEYKVIPVDIGKGQQFESEFLKISPNNKIPAIVDHNLKGIKDSEMPLFESGAILLYLAEKVERFIPTSPHEKYEVIQWLFWQMGGLGPMLGQNHHFSAYAEEKIPYAIDRYVNETSRLYQVMENLLKNREYLAGDYSIADMACYPWIVPYERQRQDINLFPNLKKWFEMIKNRPAVIKAYEIGERLRPPTDAVVNDETRKILFGQSNNTIK